jgi:hypothetical protein
VRKAGISVGWRQGAAAIGLAAVVVSSIVLYRYLHRPIFANDFSQGELDLLPAWHVAPMALARGGTLLVDHRLNIALVAMLRTGDAISSTGLIVDENGQAIQIRWIGKTAALARNARNQLMVINSEGATTYALPPGKARSLEDGYGKGGGGFDSELATLTPESRGDGSR